jgi:protein-S-isoprenylcysteine O-methyltransferase Ste14
MDNIKLKSDLLTTVQLFCMGVMVLWSFTAPLTFFPLLLIIAGLALGLWSVITIRFGNFQVAPVPKSDAKLVMTGPFSVIRHPIYLAVVLIMKGIAININVWFGYAVLIILVIDLIIKLRFEEELLLAKFPDYADYMKRTKRVIPFVW